MPSAHLIFNGKTKLTKCLAKKSLLFDDYKTFFYDRDGDKYLASFLLKSRVFGPVGQLGLLDAQLYQLVPLLTANP